MENMPITPEIKLVFPGIPKAVQSFRFAQAGKFARKYQPTTTVEWKNYLKILALQQLPPGFSAYGDVALVLSVAFVFPLPKSAKKEDKLAVENGEYLPHKKRPDLTDNLKKGLCDAMTGTVWSDDSKISVEKENSKCYGKDPRILLSVRPWDKSIDTIKLPF